MKFLIVFTAIVALAASRPSSDRVEVSQDTLGNYRLFYNIPEITRSEEATNGLVKGSFSFLDDKKEMHKIDYTSGVDGFRASGKSIPLPVAETPEVALARKEHSIAFEEMLRKVPLTEEFDLGSAPLAGRTFVTKTLSPIAIHPAVRTIHIDVPVYAADTPEIIKAKLEHEAARIEAVSRLV